MSFESYLNQAWNDHGDNSKKVSEEFENGISLITNENEILQIAGLITHVMGEHLCLWNDGIKKLELLKKCKAYNNNSIAEIGINRSIAILKLCDNENFSLNDFSLSDKTRIYTSAAASLMKNNIERTQIYFNNAINLADKISDTKDPAIRVIAINSNNLACELEEKTDRNISENSLMILAAKTARKFWELAGTWTEVERAEYRLAQSYLKAGKKEKAMAHAQLCFEICKSNNADAIEMFFAYEVLALTQKENNNIEKFNLAQIKISEIYSTLSSDDQSWCKPILDKCLKEQI